MMFELSLGSVYASQHYCSLAWHCAHILPIPDFELNPFYSINGNGHKMMGPQVLPRHDNFF